MVEFLCACYDDDDDDDDDGDGDGDSAFQRSDFRSKPQRNSI